MSRQGKKTHAMRVLDSEGISYVAAVYDDRAEFHTAEKAAAMLGLPLAAMYKTLVVLREGGARQTPIVVMIPSDSELDLKVLAATVGEKKLRMATQREAEQLTGMQVGGISVLGLKRPGFEVLIDDRAQELETIHISAGERGIELALRTEDLMLVSGARCVRATR